MTLTDARLETMSCSDPYMNNNQVVVVMADSDYETLADLAGKKLALQTGSSAEEALNNNADFKNSLGVVNTFENNMLAMMDLESGSSDAVLMDEIVANYYIANEGSPFKVIGESLASEEYGIGFRKADTELRDEVNAALKELAKNGKLAEISTKWFGKDVTTIKAD
jgi:polar amino acid transport system substrate-binding protein